MNFLCRIGIHKLKYSELKSERWINFETQHRYIRTYQLVTCEKCGKVKKIFLD